MTKQVSENQWRVQQLMTVNFVFHAWQNLPIIVPDGVMCQIDTKRIDVDNENKGGGLGYLKRMRLIPLPNTTKPVINNHTGFSASQNMIGTQADLNAQGQAGLGLGLAGGGRVNVSPVDSTPNEKLSDLTATYGVYGLIGVGSLNAQSPAQEKRAQEIFAVVTNGLTDTSLMEDLPEYFGDFSPFIATDRQMQKVGRTADGEIKDARYFVEWAAGEGLEITPREINIGDPNSSDGYKTVMIGGENPIQFSAVDYTAALELIEEIKISVAMAHMSAIGDAPNSVLPKSRDSKATGAKKSYDALDRYLMGQFPSFEMDTEIEKANRQLLRAIDNSGGEQTATGVPYEVWLEEKRRNDELAERMAALEAKTATVETANK